MTQIKHVSAKEMTRRTGVRNALGYTFPKKNLILLRKGLKGKKKRNVLDHEIEHLEKGEEGPFLGSLGASVLAPVAGAAVGELLGGRGAGGAYKKYGGMAAGQYAPYSQFGSEQLGGLKNWLAGPTGAFSPVSAQDVMASPEYQTALGTMESSAAARGGLQSGNFLRRVSQELAPQGIEREKQRRYQELQQRLGLVTGVGMPAASGTAGVYGGMAAPMAQAAQVPGNVLSGVSGDIAGLMAQQQQQQQWQDFLNKAYPEV